MQLERLLDLIEDSPDRIGAHIAGELLHVAIREEVDVQLRAEPPQNVGEVERRSSSPISACDAVGLEKRADQRRLLLGAQGEPFVERDGRQIGVHDRGCNGVLGAADDQRLVDELILRPPQPTDFVDHVLPARGLVRGNEKHLEIGPECCAAAKGGREPIGRNVGDFVAALPFGGIVLVIPRDDGGRNPLGQKIEAS